MKYLKKYNENIDWDWMDEEEDPNLIPDDFKGNEDFYNFLKDNNALEKWINNLDKNLDKNETIHIFLKNNENYKKEFINFAFTWSNTPEGENFWMKLDSEWKGF